LLAFESNSPDLVAPPPQGGAPERLGGHAGTVAFPPPRPPGPFRALGLQFRNMVASIIGDEDDRGIFFDTRHRPERLVCALVIKAANGLFHGTGWLAGPRLVVTCGHCVFHPRMGGWAQSIELAPGLSESTKPFGTATSTRFSAAQAWIRDGDKAADIGAIHLSEALGERLGWFAAEAIPHPQAIVGQVATIAGYPLFDGGYSRQMKHSEAITGIAAGRLFYPIDTGEGQSGAPIWLGGVSEADPAVIGVHAYEEEQTPAHLNVEANSGTPFSQDALQLIRTWRDMA